VIWLKKVSGWEDQIGTSKATRKQNKSVLKQSILPAGELSAQFDIQVLVRGKS
jgi:hypothetical protein